MTRTVLGKKKQRDEGPYAEVNQSILSKILPDNMFTSPQNIGNVCIFGPEGNVEQLNVQSRPKDRHSRICVPVPQPTKKCTTKDPLCNDQ